MLKKTKWFFVNFYRRKTMTILNENEETWFDREQNLVCDSVYALALLGALASCVVAEVQKDVGYLGYVPALIAVAGSAWVYGQNKRPENKRITNDLKQNDQLNFSEIEKTKLRFAENGQKGAKGMAYTAWGMFLGAMASDLQYAATLGALVAAAASVVYTMGTRTENKISPHVKI